MPVTASEINAALLRGGNLQSTLTTIESIGTATPIAIARAFSFAGVDPKSDIYSGGTQDFLGKQLAGGAITHTFARSCLNVDEARILLLEIRRAIRAELGLPAPTN